MISLRKKRTKQGVSLYFDFNRTQNRYEFLNLYLYDHKCLGRRLTQKEKEINKGVLQKVEIIRAKRLEQQNDDVYKLNVLELKKKLHSSFLSLTR